MRQLPADPLGSGLLDLLDPTSASVSAAGSADNADPHPVTLRVLPRDVHAGPAGCSPHQWEAEYEFTVGHPASRSGYAEQCPVADHLDVVGIDQSFHAGFPEPDDLADDDLADDDLADEDLAALDGTVRFVTITRRYTRCSGPYGGEWDVEYDFDWSD